jgi:nucleotide-binding universal stress UspA family protein
VAGYVPATELAPGQDTKGQQIIDDAVQIVQNATKDRGPVQINTKIFFSPTVPTLVELTTDAQLVAVGCRGHGALRRALLGSISTAWAHHAHCPVAVIHDEVVPAPHSPVLVGIDGSPALELATAIAFDEASRRGVDLVALHAWRDSDVSDVLSVAWSAIEPTAEETLAERLAGWQDRCPHVHVHQWWCWINPRAICCASRKRPNSSSWEATAEVDSPECCSDR